MGPALPKMQAESGIKEKPEDARFLHPPSPLIYSTVTDLARFLG